MRVTQAVVAGALLALAAPLAPAAAETLAEALALAYANNPTLRAARATVRVADEAVPQALSGWRPTVRFNSTYGKQYTDNGMTLALIAHSYAFSDSMLVRISSMCDAHFKFAIENIGDRLIKTLEVSKVRGAQMSTGNIISFDIEPGWGMRIIPYTKAKA